MADIKQNTAYSFNATLIGTDGTLQVNPTLASGDIVVFTDAASANIGSLPMLLTGSDTTLVVELTAPETNGGLIVVEFKDQTNPPEWLDTSFFFETSTNSLDDITISSGNVNADVKKIDGSATAAIALKKMCGPTIFCTVVADGSNSNTSFKTDLSGVTDQFGDATGGHVLLWTDANLQGQTKRVSGFNSSTQFITVESAFTGIPNDGSNGVLLGRIEL